MTSVKDDHQDQLHTLASFKMRAAVDWVRVLVTTTEPTQGRHVHSRLPSAWRAFAKPQPLEGETESACTVFSVTIQDPPTASDIGQTLKLALLAPQRVEAIEVALDLYQRQHDDQHGVQLALAAYQLHRHLATPPTGTPRICEPGHYRAASRPQDAINALQQGFTINTGTQDAQHRTRCYVKTHDSSTHGRYEPLLPAQHRARLEVTLSGSACPVTSLADLAAFRFETLTRHFAQVTTTTSASPLTSLLVEQLTQLGTPANATVKAQHRRQSLWNTRRDTVANKRIHDAMRRLTTTRKNAEVAVFSDPENRPSGAQNAAKGTTSKYFMVGEPAPTRQRQQQHADRAPRAARITRCARSLGKATRSDTDRHHAPVSLRSIKHIVAGPCTPYPEQSPDGSPCRSFFVVRQRSSYRWHHSKQPTPS